MNKKIEAVLLDTSNCNINKYQKAFFIIHQVVNFFHNLSKGNFINPYCQLNPILTKDKLIEDLENINLQNY